MAEVPADDISGICDGRAVRDCWLLRLLGVVAAGQVAALAGARAAPAPPIAAFYIIASLLWLRLAEGVQPDR